MAEFPLTWVVVADSARARVFEWVSRNADLRELLDLTNSQARLQEQALTSDRPGVGFSSRGQGRRRMQAANTEVDNTIGRFARELAAELKSGLDDGRYQRLVLMAGPSFLGQLRDQLDDQVSKRVADSA